MLDFLETPDYYQITQITHSFHQTTKLIVQYSKDLKLKRVNSDPWRETTQDDINWFNKYYKHKF